MHCIYGCRCAASSHRRCERSRIYIYVECASKNRVVFNRILFFPFVCSFRSPICVNAKSGSRSVKVIVRIYHVRNMLSFILHNNCLCEAKRLPAELFQLKFCMSCHVCVCVCCANLCMHFCPVAFIMHAEIGMPLGDSILST